MMDAKMEEKQKSLLLSFPIINTTTLAQLGAVMTDENIRLLQSLGIAKRFARKSALAYTNAKIESLLFLHRGLTRSVGISKNGVEKIYTYTAGGCFLGEAAFFHQQPVLYDIQFLEESEALFIDRSHLPEILVQPRLMLFMMTATSLTSRMLAMQIEDAAFRNQEEKVCRMLACMSGREQQEYKLSFTHQELADLIGVHRVNVTNTLNILKKEGVIRTEARGRIIIIDRDKLCRRISLEE